MDDLSFQEEIKVNMEYGNILHIQYNYELLKWWEFIVKPGILKIVIENTKALNKSNTGRLNLLYLQQLHFCKNRRPVIMKQSLS